MGSRSGISASSKLRFGREWLRSRGPVALAAALLLEVSSATAQNGTGAVGLLRAALLVVLLLGVLIAAAVDALLTSAARAVVRAATSAERWARTSVLGLPAALDLPATALLDRSGRPLRGGARNARIAMLQREHAKQAYARSLRGRLGVALAELRRVARPYSRRVAGAALALESRVLALRAALIARSIDAAAWVRPRALRAVAIARTRGALLWQATRARVLPVAGRAIATARPLAAGVVRQSTFLASALLHTTTVGLSRSRAGLAALPIPSVPVPHMSLRMVRVISVGVLMSFVFATVIGTTGLMANRGSVALGASTTLAIISGDVSVMNPGASEFRPAFDGDILGAGSTLKTGPDAYAVLTYFEGSTVSVDPNTVLVIETLQANPDGSTVIGMRQDIGQTWHAVTKLLTAGSKYEVRTPTATATVRGTLFLVGVRLSGDLGLPETLIETTEGAVAAEREPTPEQPEGEEIIVPAGFQVKTTQSTPIPPPIPAPEPERKVTVTVGTSNSVVVDPQGRSNGEVNGRIVVQTPGATVEKVDGKIVVTLPNTTDGKISTIIQPAAPDDDAPPAPVQVTTVVQERGKGESRSEETVQQTTQPTVTGVDLKKSADGNAPPDVRRLDDEEKKAAPKVKVAEAPAEEVRALTERRAEDAPKTEDRGSPRQGEAPAGGQGGEPARAEPSPKGIVNAIVTLTLPPLSAEEVARREAQKRESEERERRESQRREEQRRQEEQQKIDELRRQEAEARARAQRIGGERQQEEGRRDERRDSEDRRGQEVRREEERQGNAPAAPVALFQQVVRAIAPADGNARRGEDSRVDELKKQEEEARKAAEKAAEERRRAEQRQREDAIKAEEEKRKDSERRAEELRKAEERAKQDEARKLEELRRIEEKAREQAAKLADDQRREAERRLTEFREAEERKRREEAKQLEDQRRAQERAQEESESKLRELRRQEEEARERERERQREQDREEERRRNRGGFVPNVELKPAPGIGTRSVDEERERSEQLREKQQDKQEKAAESNKRTS